MIKFKTGYEIATLGAFLVWVAFCLNDKPMGRLGILIWFWGSLRAGLAWFIAWRKDRKASRL